MAEYYSNLSAIGASICFLLCGCQRESSSKTVTKEFVSRFEVRVLDSGSLAQPIEDVNPGADKFLDISWTPAPNAPAVLDGQAVPPPREWGTVVYLYRKGSNRSAKDATFLRWGRTWNPKEPRFPPGHFKGVQRMVAVLGDSLGPEPPARAWTDGEIRSWVHLTPPKGETGEWEYEIVIYPAVRDISYVEFDLGTPLSMWRGTMRVVSDSDKTQ